MGVREKYRGRPPLPVDWAARLERLPDVLTRHGVRLAYLFGSAADAQAANGSAADGRAAKPARRTPEDIDLGFLPGADFRLRPFCADVSETLGTDRVDLVDLRLASPALLYEIVSQGRVVHRADEETENAFEHAVLARYRDDAVRLAAWARH